MGAASALIFSNLGAAYGTAKSGVGVASMGVMRPELVMRCIIPVVMAGVLGIYGLIVAAREVWCLLLTRVLMFSLRSHPLSWTFCLRRMQSSCRVRWWRRTTRTFWDSPIWPLDCRTA
ncbi:hypothetical protein I4F81_003360 [Pyropia yezoensis]|uniref:Uncharacterized protein n=1 Tax=Pyropia yezoensis TaxID=2788 RepID=A0ACC3BT50_PYRYE|nr:hypothetical protein I4F81_003360 [Neopyropia yezoensis]